MTSDRVCCLWPFVLILCSTRIVQLSNRNLYFYRFWCYHPLVTQLTTNTNHIITFIQTFGCQWNEMMDQGLNHGLHSAALRYFDVWEKYINFWINIKKCILVFINFWRLLLDLQACLLKNQLCVCSAWDI